MALVAIIATTMDTTPKTTPNLIIIIGAIIRARVRHQAQAQMAIIIIVIIVVLIIIIRVIHAVVTPSRIRGAIAIRRSIAIEIEAIEIETASGITGIEIEIGTEAAVEVVIAREARIIVVDVVVVRMVIIVGVIRGVDAGAIQERGEAVGIAAREVIGGEAMITRMRVVDRAVVGLIIKDLIQMVDAREIRKVSLK